MAAIPIPNSQGQKWIKMPGGSWRFGLPDDSGGIQAPAADVPVAEMFVDYVPGYSGPQWSPTAAPLIPPNDLVKLGLGQAASSTGTTIPPEIGAKPISALGKSADFLPGWTSYQQQNSEIVPDVMANAFGAGGKSPWAAEVPEWMPRQRKRQYQSLAMI